MSKRILVIYDNSDVAVKALTHALTLTYSGDSINILYIIDKSTYNNIREGVESMGGGESDLNRAVTDIEHRFRKRVSNFLQECRNRGINAHTLFKIGNIYEEVLNEINSRDYSLVVIPHSQTFKEKIVGLLESIIKNFHGNILIVK